MKIIYTTVLFFTLATFISIAVESNSDPTRFYENTYIVTFKASDPKNGQTVKDLLDCLHRNMGNAYDKTHHFRTIVKNNELIGKICVNSKSGIDKFVENLTKSKEIIFIECTKPSLAEFIEHTKTKQEELGMVQKRYWIPGRDGSPSRTRTPR